jgi:hypothetical protein
MMHSAGGHDNVRTAGRLVKVNRSRVWAGNRSQDGMMEETT